MRICFITNFIPPYRKTFYEKLCAGSGHAWLVLRGQVQGETGRPDFRGAIAAPLRQLENFERTLGPFTLRFQKGALAAARSHNPDVLVVLGMAGNLSNWLVMLWARLTGRRVLIWACGWEPQRAGSLSLGAKQVLMRMYYGLAHKCLLYSTKGLDYLALNGVARGRMSVCYNGIEIDGLQADEASILDEARRIRLVQCEGGEFVFLYVGALLEEKRVDLLLAAFDSVYRALPRARLWIVGDGPDATRLQSLARQLAPGSVRFFGRIVDGVDAYFAAADAFVLPGLGGLAFNQAMFWRTPCIGSVADGTEDDLVIEGVTGFRFRAGERESLQSAMLEASRMPDDRRRELGEAAHRVIVERSNVDYMVRTFLHALVELESPANLEAGHSSSREPR